MSAPDHRFSKDEAARLVGRRVRSLTPYTFVPSGTTGTVVAAEEVGPGRFELVVEFDITGAPRDWFTRSGFLDYLTEA